MNTLNDLVAAQRALAAVLARIMGLPSPPAKRAPFAVSTMVCQDGDDLLEEVARTSVAMQQDLLCGVTVMRNDTIATHYLALIVVTPGSAAIHAVEVVRLKVGKPVLLVAHHRRKAWRLTPAGVLVEASVPSRAAVEAGIDRAARGMSRLLDFDPAEAEHYKCAILTPAQAEFVPAR